MMSRIAARVLLIAGLFPPVVTTLLPSAEAQARRPAQPAPPSLDASAFSQLRYRYVGPVGNRVTSAQGVPGDPHT